ncbi:MAG: hypothetical protein WCK82_12745, partial [Bacteroidota bacterium]|jgi:ribosomal protein L25 (general stress protein Ctc)
MQNDIVKKLRLDTQGKTLLVDIPDSLLPIFDGISYDLKPLKKNVGTYDYVHVFADNQKQLEELVKSLRQAGKYDCVFWASYPKGTGKIKSDIKRETVWKAFDLIGQEAVTQVAINDTWSALRARPYDKVGTKNK